MVVLRSSMVDWTAMNAGWKGYDGGRLVRQLRPYSLHELRHLPRPPGESPGCPAAKASTQQTWNQLHAPCSIGSSQLHAPCSTPTSEVSCWNWNRRTVSQLLAMARRGRDTRLSCGCLPCLDSEPLPDCCQRTVRRSNGLANIGAIRRRLQHR